MDGPSYPQWVRDVCAGLRCYVCKAPLGIAHLVEVAVERSSKVPFPFSKPRVCLVFGCHNCHQRVRVIDFQPQQQILKAAEAFMVGDDDLGGPPSDAPVPFDASTAVATPLTKEADPRRFVMPPPLTGIEESEARVFLYRVSFRRRSASFRRWMKQLGIDIDDS